ncbi:glycosyltransferase [Sediminitomix flava]|uniref:Glycosyltransferase involved in cell wall biosynthesis n=1 Tax=Sediminitomix flava TaxID=379075 RepID=A0A315Z6X8_SEDFL|nr:glycosyltransferase [Sediminitomix flava]PWJ38515.1 glycosyltransferase involved in cell wall biosynthesis [Sediminitomix flava]
MNFENLPIVFQGLPRWDGPYASTSVTVAKKLSENHQVFYIDHPFTLKDKLGSKDSPQLMERTALWADDLYYQTPYPELPNFINVCPKPVLPINFLPKGFIYQKFCNYVNQQVWKQIDDVLDKYGVEEFIYVNSFDPVYSRIYTSKRVILNVYHCVDLISGEKYIAKHGVEAEKSACNKADFVICTSRPLKKKLYKFNENCYAVENAVDYEFFQKSLDAEVPEDLAMIPGKKLVYTGNIGLRLDYQLIKEAAENMPDYSFVFIGPINQREFRGQELKKLPNVHFLGQKAFEDIPAYIKGADVCLIPFRRTELTKHIYPLKINEYLAMGKPVITSDFTDLSEFGNVTYRYLGIRQFTSQIEKAIEEDSEVKIADRKVFAAKNTWDHRICNWEAIFKNALKNKEVLI